MRMTKSEIIGALLVALTFGMLLAHAVVQAHSDAPEAEHLSTYCINSYASGCWKCSHYDANYDVSTETASNDREDERREHDFWCRTNDTNLANGFTCEPVHSTDAGSHAQFKAQAKTLYQSIETAKTHCGYHTGVGAHRHIQVPSGPGQCGSSLQTLGPC